MSPLRRAGGRVRLPGRPVGLRQEHHAADGGRPAAAVRRRHRGRRQGDHGARPRARHGVPEGQRVPLDAGASTMSSTASNAAGVPQAERRDIARTYLQRVGLAHVEHAWPRELSGGMLKRVAIATVFANGAERAAARRAVRSARLRHQRQLQTVLLDLWDEGGAAARRTVLFVTHDVDEALALADRILVLHSGRQVDDLAVTAARPRTTDSLLLPEMVAIKHTCWRISGLERPVPRMAAGGAAVSAIVNWPARPLRVRLRLPRAGRALADPLDRLHRPRPSPGEPMVAGWQVLVHPDLPLAWPTTGRAASASPAVGRRRRAQLPRGTAGRASATRSTRSVRL